MSAFARVGLGQCTTCADEGWDCYPHADSQQIECPGEECGTCDYAYRSPDPCTRCAEPGTNCPNVQGEACCLVCYEAGGLHE